MFENYNINDRHRLSIHCLITTQSPLSHIGEVVGNVSNLKTLEIMGLDGNFRKSFVYSGNALRNGLLRRLGVASALDTLGMQVNPDVHHSFFAGGRMEQPSGSDIALDSKIRQLCPWASVLGMAKPCNTFGVKHSQMIPGRINIGSAYLVCWESVDYIYSQFPAILPMESLDAIAQLKTAKHKAHALRFPDGFTDNGNSSEYQAAIAELKQMQLLYFPKIRQQMRSYTEHIIVDQTTRRDSLEDAGLVQYLSPQEAPKLPGKGGKEKESDRMISSDRLIAPGSQLYSRWDFHGTDIEEGFIYDALLRFSQYPYLGGKGNRGNGLVSMQLWYDDHDGNTGELLSIVGNTVQLSIRAANQHQRYREYLEEYRQFLEDAKASKDVSQLLGATAK